MDFRESIAHSIQSVFNHTGIANAKNAVAHVGQSAVSDPLPLLLFITFIVGAAALMIAIIAIGRRGHLHRDTFYLEERLQTIEAILRDGTAARSIHDKRVQGDMEYIRRELNDIHAALEARIDRDPPLRRVANS